MLTQLAAAILATLPAPSGHIYAALSAHGCTPDQYAQILGALADTGLVMLDGQMIRITEEGEDYLLLASGGSFWEFPKRKKGRTTKCKFLITQNTQ